MTLYEILDLEISASEDEIRSTYSRLLAQYSLEAAKGERESAEKKISDLKYAKKILLNPDERKNYDAALLSDISKNNTVVKVSLKKEPREQDVIPTRLDDTPAEAKQITANLEASIQEKSDINDVNRKIIISKSFIISNTIVFFAIVAAVIIINMCV